MVVTELQSVSRTFGDQLYDLFPNDRFQGWAGAPRPACSSPHTLLSLRRSSSWVAGMIFRVMEPWDWAWKGRGHGLTVSQVEPPWGHVLLPRSENSRWEESQAHCPAVTHPPVAAAVS